ncbi:molybdate ABC transporter ATP-binding protein ModF [Marinomonas sp. 2405UD68-3]|uniref:molybdate ABC transporter ATP-binding protein ModF n=1 Tax=Marinomonas sp. 2405UD68-3 TaxID=3391835 RepID=UPI0039C922FD
MTNSIVFSNASVTFDEGFQLDSINWTIEPGQHWAITGANGAGKSALAATLSGVGKCASGTISGLPNRVAMVSFEVQAQIIAEELKKDDADIMDVISEGTPVRELLLQDGADEKKVLQLIDRFQLDYLLDRAFRKLSTGESRKVILIRALASKPNLLILDEPFDGLDTFTLSQLQAYLLTICQSMQIIFVLNRFDEFPDFVTHIGYVNEGRLEHKIERQDSVAFNSLYQLMHLKTTDIVIPKSIESQSSISLDSMKPLVKLANISVKYEDTAIIEGLDWTIYAGEHWQLSGPNGSGKTALLSLITGDHPQCYSNDIFVFGFQRGNGESIWEIKQYIGYVSTALQWEYRVSTNLRNVIISGFYDSIGMYNKSTDQQKVIADEWLQLLGMANKADQPFNKQSYGDQRLLLIARAMVKHPPLLILDEPCLGLDDMNRQLVLALIEKICADSDSTVLYVNHHAEDKIAGIKHYLALRKNG